MGTWSTTILGSDTALDAICQLADLIGMDEGSDDLYLYPLPDHDDTVRIKLIRIHLESNPDKVMNGQFDPFDYPIIACAYICSGATMPLGLREKALQSCQDQLRDLSSWDDPDERRAVLERHIGLLGSHEPGLVQVIEHEGLMDRIMNGLGETE